MNINYIKITILKISSNFINVCKICVMLLHKNTCVGKHNINQWYFGHHIFQIGKQRN